MGLSERRGRDKLCGERHKALCLEWATLQRIKYAFDNEWVGPAGRVVTGLVCGVGVIVWSEYMRQKGYAVFSYSLKAIGIGVIEKPSLV